MPHPQMASYNYHPYGGKGQRGGKSPVPAELYRELRAKDKIIEVCSAPRQTPLCPSVWILPVWWLKA